MNDGTTSGDPAGGREPNLTQTNSRTIKGEETLADDDGTSARTSTPPRDGVIPSSYGAAGGMTPDTDEGGGGNDSDAE